MFSLDSVDPSIAEIIRSRGKALFLAAGSLVFHIFVQERICEHVSTILPYLYTIVSDYLSDANLLPLNHSMGISTDRRSHDWLCCK